MCHTRPSRRDRHLLLTGGDMGQAISSVPARTGLQLLAEAARKRLSHVISNELPDPPDLDGDADGSGWPQDGTRQDWATATAWKLMAECGPRVWLSGTSDAGLHVPETTLAMNAADRPRHQGTQLSA